MSNARVLSTLPSAGFAPTVLLVKTHNVTGKKYFCKTTQLKRVHWYTGSGVHWKRHLKKHGNDVTTGVLGLYTDRERCVEAAIKFSIENDIVNSKDWLNAVIEDGLTGFQTGPSNYSYGKENRYKGKERPEMKGRFVGPLNPRYGKPSPMRGKKNLGASLALKGRKRPEGGGKPSRPVIRTDAEGNTVTYASITEAARAISKCRSMVNRCCVGKQKTYAGYTWGYVNGS